MYDRYPISPFHHGRCFANWTKVIFWPTIARTKLYHMLYIYHRDNEQFTKIKEMKEAKGDENYLPTEMNEADIELYQANKRRDNSIRS